MGIMDGINIATAVISLASVICALTATPKDDKIVGKAYKILELFAVNFGRAKEKSRGF